MGRTPDMGVTPESDSSCRVSAAADTSSAGGNKLPHRLMQRPLPVEVSAAAESLQELSLSSVTIHVVYTMQDLVKASLLRLKLK